MNKRVAIEKINKMGKVGNVLINISKVLVGIGIVACLALFIASMILPENFLRIKSTNNVEISMDLAALNVDMSTIDENDFIAGMNEGLKVDVSVKAADKDLAFDRIEGSVVTMSSGDDVKNINTKDAIYLGMAGLLTCIMCFVTLVFCGRLCKSFAKCESPFEEKIIKNMRLFGYSLIPWVILDSIGKSLFNSFINGHFQMNISLNLTTIVIVVFVLVLVYIFRYGAVLQQESDETL